LPGIIPSHQSIFVLNRLVLSAEVIEKNAMRYTPAGLPVLDLTLKHESDLMQNDQIRRIVFEIKARGIGDITQALEQLELGRSQGFVGFLGAQRNGRGIVFHITELGPLSPG
jgi:primosomal replication protein N